MNLKKISTHRRTISVLLTVCMLVACLPLNALSAGEPPAAGSAALPPAETSGIEESSEVCIVEEDLSKRGEYEKHFLCSDGTYIAVTYAEPVHYLDADGTWADTDVALSLNTASSRYEAQSGGFAVSFASAYSASAQQPAAVSMTDGAFPVSWTTAVAGTLLPAAGRSGLQASASCDALVPYTPSVSVLTAQQSQAASLQSFAGRPVADADSFAAPDRISVAQYTGIAQTAGQSAGVSLRYSVSQHRIKEDIIIADKSAVTDFVTTLDIGALTAAPQDDGSVLLTDGNGDTVYTVGVPYLYDAEYNVSYGVEVTVSQTGSVCRITYSPDREWMFSDERVYPVVLDPTITSGEYAANIVDTYVTQADSNNHSGEGNLVVGIKSGKINRAYIKINNLPSLPDDVVPLSANLTIKHGANTTTGRAMTLYRVNSSWSPSSITYANQPTSFTTIASCAFNTSNVSFNLSQSQTRDLYTRKANGTNYGYRIRYSSESTTNPDYNMLRSMEYPTASEKPCFTVRYGYSLPTGLATGIIYSFKNAGSVKYLDVSGGTDADNTNVIQWGWNGSAAQQFKLELSSTGNGYILRSQVGGKTRVLDIYKTNGRVENGNNVQIYRNVDPIAQEWLIIPVSQFYYKIVPRSNPALALTSYGSSNGSSTGKSTTSAGNVFVSTYTGNSQNQWWIIEKQDGTVIQPGYPPIADGEYYLNSINTSKYIRNLSGSVRSASGTIASLGSSIKWKFTNMGGKYLIQPMNNTSLYLAGGTSTIEDTVSLIEIDGEIPSRCLWTVSRQPTSNRLTIKSHLYRTLCGNDTSLSTEIYPTCDDEWRFVAVDEMNEIGSNFLNSFDDMYITQTKTLSISDTSADFIYASDFSYTIQSASPSDCISINFTGVSNKITANKAGEAYIKVVHKPSQKASYFDVTVRKDAIIILPGIMGSRFFANETFNIEDQLMERTVDAGEQVWDPPVPPFYDPELFIDIWRIDALVLTLSQNESGDPLYPVGVKAPSINEIKQENDEYGTLDTYRNLYINLYNTYCNTYDVILYEYDWRKDPYDTANELDTYISNNYGRVIFVSHSMGGLVSSYYLAKGNVQRERVIKHISLGTPYLGAEKMPYVMMTGKPLDSIIQDLAVSDPIKRIIWNLKSTYALIPMEQNFRSYLKEGYINGDLYITLGTYNSYASTINAMSERCPNWNSTLYHSVKSHQASLYTYSGNHITSLVDSYYIIGDGETTSQMTTLYHSYIDDSDFYYADLDNKTDDGDGTVTIHSATINGTVDSDRTFYTYGITHQDLAGGDDTSDADLNKVVNFVKAIINDQADSMSDATLENSYNMFRSRQ